MTILPNAWLRVVTGRESVQRRLFCFAHSGAGPQVFTAWKDAVDQHTEVIAINLPGRNDRSSEPAVTEMHLLVAEVTDALVSSGALTLPFAFFGHSFGALVAYDTTLRLASQNGPLPMHIFASASESPVGLLSRTLADDAKMRILDDDAFLAALSKWGVLPAEIADNDELRAAVLPALRADIGMFEDYAGNDAKLPSATTLSIIGGADDTSISTEGLQSWSAHAETVESLTLPGDHFYFNDEASLQQLLTHINTTIRSCFSKLPLAIGTGGDAEYLHETRTTWELIRDQAKKTPNAVAIVDHIRGETTYSDMWKFALKIAKQINILTEGRKGVTVGMMLPHCADYICTMLGIWAAGGCFLVLERAHPPEMLQIICQTCNPDGSGKPDIIITQSEFLGSFQGKLADVPKLVLDEHWEDIYDYAGYTPSAGDLSARAILMTTSGTSGIPKLIEGSHKFQQVGMMSRRLMMPYTNEQDREACSVMFVWEAPRSLVHGHVCVVIPETVIIDPIGLVSYLIEHKATRILTTPSLAATVYSYLESTPKVSKELQETLCRWFFMGEVCTAKLIQQALRVVPKITCVNAYSTWEAADTTMLEGSAMYLKPYSKFYPVGKLHEGVTAVVLDPETRQPVPRNVPGELFTTGPHLSNGYAMAPELTADRFILLPKLTGIPEVVSTLAEKNVQLDGTEKWYKSGDLAVMHADGVVELHGRIDSTVKIRGFKVGLPFVEGVLADIPHVELVVVVPTFDKDSNQPDAIAALLKPIDECTLSFADLVTFIKKDVQAKMPKVAIPTFILPILEIAQGNIRMGGEAKKINRRAIPKLFTKELKEKYGTKKQNAVVRDISKLSSLEATVSQVWAEVLELDEKTLDDEENFFELGGHSLLASTLTQKLSAATSIAVSVLDLYENSTLKALVTLIAKSANPMESRALLVQKKPRSMGYPDIAIVGMAGRFPGAANIYEFWDNLKHGRVTPTYHTDEFLAKMGVDPEVIEHPDFVKVAYKIDDVDKFDAKFWGIGRTEAMTMDPQHRVFVETAWNAIENAGYAPKTGFEGANDRVGVFASAGIDGYLVHHLEGGALKKPLEPGNLFMTEVASEKDYIATRVSYLMNLRGPSMNVNSACSSALVAVAQACASIAVGESDMAVAGGASINFPNIGFLYQDGLIYSRDGLVKPLDQDAAGTAFGDAVGAVVLKKLDRAVEDGDNIWGVIRGFGTSNDGSVKVGYSAPAAAGQADCIKKAFAMTDLTPKDVSYVEMHATGTLVGDGIEAKGLNQAWTESSAEPISTSKWCAVGSVKGNIAHANCAAGITGLIKTALMMKHKQLVPTANYQKLNDKVVFDGTPFYVNDKTQPWEPASGIRAAGVSSFGIGGTNTHLVLSEHATSPLQSGGSYTATLLFSAKSKDSLSATMVDLATFLQKGYLLPADTLADVAHTLRTGRELYPIRHSVAVNSDDSMEKIAEQITQAAAAADGKAATKKPVVAFFCPGQGSQYLQMAQGLYKLPTFKIHFDECAEGLKPLIKKDIREIVFGEDKTAFGEPSSLQPSLFAVEYAVARLLMSVNVVPDVIAGHSIGEYVAAVLGGHITLQSALNIIAVRALGTTHDVSEGAMLSVSLPEEQAVAAIQRSAKASSLWLAAANSPMHSVISGSNEAVDVLKDELAAFDPKIKAAKLHVNRPFHSALMQPAADQLLMLSFEKPSEQAQIPTTSNVTGHWLDDDVRTGSYWKDHMEKTVKWRECAQGVFTKFAPTVCVEVGPGNTLSNLSSRCWNPELVGETTTDKRPAFEQAMRHATATTLRDVDVFASLLGRLWSKGVKVDWQAWNAEIGILAPRRVALPGYSFEKTSFWVNPKASIYVESNEPVAAPKPQAVVNTDMLVRFAKEVPTAPCMRMYCLPFAGGSSRAFEKWSATLNADVDVVSVELPGRGGRAGDKHLSNDRTDEAELKSLAAAIEADSKGVPFVLVGKSMGGLMAVEIARLLKHLAPKQLLGVAIAGRAPVRPLAMIPELEMSDETLNRYSLAPDSLKESEAWKTYLLPMLKADLLCDTRNEKRLSQAAEPYLVKGVKLAVFCGTNDVVCPWTEADGWKTAVEDETDASVHFMPGGHEFLNDHSQRIAQQVGMLAASWLVKAKSEDLKAATELSKAVVRPTLTQPAPMYGIQWEDSKLVAASSAEAPLVLTVTPSSVLTWEPAILEAFEKEKLVLAFNETSLTASEAACWQFLAFIQKFPDAGKKGTLTLLLKSDEFSGMIAGASKAIPFEIPEINVMRVYTDTPTDASVASQAVAACAGLKGKTNDLDIRGETVKHPVITKEKVAVPPKCPPQTPEASARILVTGWTGGLGSELLKYLVEKMGIAPSKLVLLSRRPTENPYPAAAELAIVPSVTDPSALQKNTVLKELFASKFALLHLAGALDDAMISNQTEERLKTALQPKVVLFDSILSSVQAAGGQLLWTVAFSSTSSLFGYPGQSNYCAANGFLDATSSFRPSDKVLKKMVAISWGPWGEVGMAKKGSKAYELAVKEGDTPLDTQPAMTCLGHVLTLLFNDLPTRSQYAVCDVEWTRSPWSELPLLAPVVEKLVAAAAVNITEPTAQESGSTDDFSTRVKAWLTKEVGRTAWEQVADEDMAALGLDSLDTVQLRNAYNKHFQASAPLALFSKPNLTLRVLHKSLV